MHPKTGGGGCGYLSVSEGALGAWIFAVVRGVRAHSKNHARSHVTRHAQRTPLLVTQHARSTPHASPSTRALLSCAPKKGVGKGKRAQVCGDAQYRGLLVSRKSLLVFRVEPHLRCRPDPPPFSRSPRAAPSCSLPPEAHPRRERSTQQSQRRVSCVGHFRLAKRAGISRVGVGGGDLDACSRQRGVREVRGGCVRGEHQPFPLCGRCILDHF